MSHFVRTTGGLLQLVHGPLTAADHEGIARFARKLGLATAQARPLPAPSSPPPSNKKKPAPCDLQAERPEIFRDLPL